MGRGCRLHIWSDPTSLQSMQALGEELCLLPRSRTMAENEGAACACLVRSSPKPYRRVSPRTNLHESPSPNCRNHRLDARPRRRTAALIPLTGVPRCYGAIFHSRAETSAAMGMRGLENGGFSRP